MKKPYEEVMEELDQIWLDTCSSGLTEESRRIYMTLTDQAVERAGWTMDELLEVIEKRLDAKYGGILDAERTGKEILD